MVALIFCGDLKYCPYIRRYIERLEHKNIAYKVYFWNRGGFQLNLPNSTYEWYDSSSSLKKSKIRKLIDFLSFRAWLIRKLIKDKPSKIIALSTLTGVLLGKYLYSNCTPYIFDIRDYSYEHIKPFYRVEKKVINNSAFTAISSKGFKHFLPEDEYVIAHNFNRNDIKEKYCMKPHTDKIRFVWNGVIRYFEFQRLYLDALKNDPRFEIVFHGDGPDLDLFVEYCNNNGFTNVIFTGSYDNDMKDLLLSNADILNNCYGYVGNAGSKLKYAVSNRFYDGLIYHIPQIVEVDGFKSEWVSSSGVGKSFAPYEDFAERLFSYYHTMDRTLFDENCNRELKRVIAEDDLYIEKIDAFIE